MKRWGFLALGLLGLAVVVWAQTIHKETVVWDFVNGVKSQGEWLTPGGGGTGDVPSTRSLTITGTANQVTVSGGTQDLSADRAWTVGLPTNVTLPGTTTGTFSGNLTGTATDASSLGGIVASAYAKLAGGGQQIITGTQVVPRANLQTISSNAFTLNLDTTDVAVVPALSAGVTVNAPTATGSNPRDYHEIIIVFLPSASSQSITWNSIFSPRAGLALPTSVTGDNSTLDMVKFWWAPTISKYILGATTIGTEPGITTLASSTTYTCSHLTARGCEMVNTEAAGTVTIAIPSGGTPVNGKQLTIKIKCTNAQTLTLTTGAGGFIASPNVPITGLTCPASGASWTAIGAEYSTVLDRFQVYATN